MLNSLPGVTLKGIFRDRVFHGILVAAMVIFFIPAVSTFSMRQVTELAMTLSLSLISFLFLLLSVFLGAVGLWKDLDRRYLFPVLGLSIKRHSYLLGKFSGMAIFFAIALLVLGSAAAIVVKLAIGIYPPDRPVAWWTFFLALGFDGLKYLILLAFGFLFSTLSTSFFLPVFGTLAVFIVGSASQQVYDFVHSQGGKTVPHFLHWVISGLYYLLPNFSAFNLSVNAVYSLPISPSVLALTLGYFFLYLGILLTLCCLLFERKDFK